VIYVWLQQGATLLHRVARNGPIDLVALLLDRGAKVDATDMVSVVIRSCIAIAYIQPIHHINHCGAKCGSTPELPLVYICTACNCLRPHCY
jgi:ankyrin repeat protein